MRCDCNLVRVGGWRLKVIDRGSRSCQRRRGRRGSQVVEELREDSQACDVLQLASYKTWSRMRKLEG